jgi:8-oxo-dGTP pyrophosphatase MutT (NUDIX family)
MWEATAGGSALQGEDAFSCAIRELREETGIVSNELTNVGQVINDDNHTIYVEYLCIESLNIPTSGRNRRTDHEKRIVRLAE